MKKIETGFRILAITLGFCCAATSHAQDFSKPGYGRSRPQRGQDQAGQRAAVQAVTEVIERTMLQQGGKWYVKFSIQPEAQPLQQPGGFAPLVVPKPAAPLVREGLIEVVFSRPPSASELPRRTGEQMDWKGEVQVRLQRFRVYDPNHGWSPNSELLIHMWQWKAQVVGNRLSLSSITDAANDTSDGGVTEFVASVFGVPAADVRCAKPSPGEIPNLDQAVSQRPWRAQYNQVAPAVRPR